MPYRYIIAFLAQSFWNHVHVVLGQDCFQCNQLQTQCARDCAYFSSAEYVSANPISFALQDCYLNCVYQFCVCCPSIASCDSGGETSDNIGDNSASLLQEHCEKTSTIANSNGDDFLSFEEFKGHVSLFTNSVCPGDAAPEAQYYDNAHYLEAFATVSCFLCMGSLDPFNPAAQDHISIDDCGCNNAAELQTISFSATTPVEVTGYCLLVYEMVFVQCYHPVPACLAQCEEEVGVCVQNCDDSAQDGAVACLNICTPLYYACIEACETTKDSAPLEGGDGGFSPGGQANGGGISPGSDGSGGEISPGGGSSNGGVIGVAVATSNTSAMPFFYFAWTMLIAQTYIFW